MGKRNNNELVSVFCDASWCHRTHASGWAVWMKFQGRTGRFSGNFKTEMFKSNEAETGAVGNGIHLAIKAFADAKVILVQSDCMHTVHLMKGNSKGGTDFEKHVRLNAHRQALLENKVLVFKHVYGHMKERNARNHVNDWCDKHARVHMERQRKDIENGIFEF